MTQPTAIYALIAASYLLISLLLGCSSNQTSTSKDIATDWSYSLTTPYKSLFYIEGAILNRGECLGNQFDRASCSRNLEKISVTRFYRELERQFAQSLSQKEEALREAFVNIDRIDVKRLELMSFDPTNDDGQQLLDRIEEKRIELSETQIIIADLKEQIFRIERDLEQNEDPSLRLLLSMNNQKLAEKAFVHDEIKNDIQELSEQYLSVNSSTIDDQALFASLSNQRLHWAKQLPHLRIEIEAQLNEKVIYHKTVKLLNDQGFSYAVVSNMPGFDEYWPVVSRLNPTFDSILNQSGGL